MPFSFASSKRMRMPSVEPMPQALTGPLKAVWLPSTISVAVTPSSASAGAASTPATRAANASPGSFLMWISIGFLQPTACVRLAAVLARSPAIPSSRSSLLPLAMKNGESGRTQGASSVVLAVAVLVFLARAARAGCIARDLAPGGGVLGVEGAGGAARLQRRAALRRGTVGAHARGQHRIGHGQLVLAGEGVDVMRLHGR